MKRGLLIVLIALTAAACDTDTEARARQAAEKVKSSIPDVEGKALAQKATPEEVREAQQALQVAKEYLGEVDGKLDSVTVNAIEAFQRSRGLTDDGMLNDKTKSALRAVVASK